METERDHDFSCENLFGQHPGNDPVIDPSSMPSQREDQIADSPQLITDCVKSPTDNLEDINSDDLGLDVSGNESEEVNDEIESNETLNRLRAAIGEDDNETLDNYDNDLEQIKSGVKKRRVIHKEVSLSLPTFSKCISEFETPPLLIKVPKFISFEPKPFDESSYEALPPSALEEINFEGIVRWRRSGDSVESNSRLVKWSDGSYSIAVGSEYYDLLERKVEEDLEHVFVCGSDNMQCVCILEKKFALRPVRMESLTRKKLLQTLSKQSSKRKCVGDIPVYVDLEAEQRKQRLREEERVRNRRKLAERQRRVRMKDRELDSSFLERGYGDSSDDGDFRFGSGSRASANDSEDEDRLNNVKRGKRGGSTRSEGKEASSSDSELELDLFDGKADLHSENT